MSQTVSNCLKLSHGDSKKNRESRILSRFDAFEALLLMRGQKGKKSTFADYGGRVRRSLLRRTRPVGIYYDDHK